MAAQTPGRHVSSDEALRALLEDAGIRVTTQRLALAALLFAGQDRHVVASQLHAEAAQRGVPISLGTVYNTLGKFVRAGLLNEVTVNSERSYFDTNLGPHAHAFDPATLTLTDVPLPLLPVHDGLDPDRIAAVEVLYRLKP